MAATVTALADCTSAIGMMPAARLTPSRPRGARRQLAQRRPGREAQPPGHQPPAQQEQADAANERVERVGDEHELPAVKVRMGGYCPM